MAKKPRMPFAGSKVAVYLAKQIDALRGIKSQREIASEIGYDKPNMISMFKRGESKVPLEKIPALAKAINVDPAFLFRLAMEQYWPKLNEAIAAVFGDVTTKNERELLNKVRQWTGHIDPKLVNSGNEGALMTAFKAPAS